MYGNTNPTQVGDQLTAVGQTSVLGMTFDGALGEIVASDGETTKLVVFRGGTSNLYGNLGPSTEWLDEFLAKQ
jgi:C-terminal processing protease CtpA/Prc